jgi:hypothetical protein
LVVLRRCEADETFMELVEASRKYALSVFALATALVAAASGGPDARDNNDAAANAVEQEWGSLLPRLSPSAALARI